MATKRPNDDGQEPDPKRQQLDVISVSPGVIHLSAWKPSDISTDLPPLPVPANPKLEQAAFTHISLNNTQNYEDLEWLGDAWIQAMSTQLIYNTFRGTFKTGRLSQLREALVCNRTLGSFLRAYGLQTRLKLPHEITESQEPRERAKKKSKDPLKPLEKVHGDCFEAYIGAILESDKENGASIVADWLRKLWARELQDEIRKYARGSGAATASGTPSEPDGDSTSTPSDAQNLNPKVLLTQAIACKGVSLNYKDMPGKSKTNNMGHSLFAVGVYYTGWGTRDELLGVGHALKKSEAGSRAAEAALKNTQAIKRFSDKKQAFLKARGTAEANVNP